MRAVERKSMWHHTMFSALLCIILVAVLVLRHDLPGFLLAGFVILYIGGNSLLHYKRKDFRKETLYEYALVSTAVLIVLLGAI